MFAHEAGHALSEHALYRTALVILLLLSRLPGVPMVLTINVASDRRMSHGSGYQSLNSSSSSEWHDDNPTSVRGSTCPISIPPPHVIG